LCVKEISGKNIAAPIAVTANNKYLSGGVGL
jgi:hypothetical protein